MNIKFVLLNFVIFSVVGCVHKSKVKEPEIHKGPIKVESEALIRYDFKEGELKNLCDQELAAFRSDIERWRKNSGQGAEAATVLLQFEDRLAELNETIAPLTFMSSVATNAKMRDESSQCEEASSLVFNEVFTNRENYLTLKNVKTEDSAEKRLLKEMLFEFEQNGMSLSENDLKKFKVLKDRLAKLSVEFSQNLNNDISTISFTAEELKGAKPDFLARLKKADDGRFIVTTKSPDYTHVMDNVESSETRRKMAFAYLNRQSAQNTPLLQEATRLRAELGQLMGYSTYADYALKEKMAGDSKTVFAFLKRLTSKLASKNRKDLKTLAQFKAQVLKDSSPLQIWDVAYVSNQLKIQKYNVDEEIIREYFPADHVVAKTLEIYSQILGVDFRKVPQAPVWAQNVQLYEVLDQKTHEALAYFYADLIPREGKYGHAAAFTLIPGRNLPKQGGVYQKPVSAIVANFSPPAPGKPSLLSHREVETFFHEFGHIMHQILTKARFATLSGTSVRRDFVEAPSQMLENWVWQKSILSDMSAHYQDPKRKMPPEMIERIQKLKFFNSGIQYTRQLVFGLFDMNIHTQPKLDVTQEYARLHEQLTGMKAIPETHFPATFTHMMGGYSAGYYGYLWSKVFAEDMFSVFEKKGLLSREVGLKYRHSILESGNMREPMELIKEFLGRAPSNGAFFKSLGL